MIALAFCFPVVWTAAANHTNGVPDCDTSAFETSPPFDDGCYHQGVWFSPDATEYDVIILPPTSPNEIRDWQLIELSLDNWELGIKELGAPWLVEGLNINDYTVGKEFVPPEALADPEVVVAIHTGADPAGYLGLAAYFPGFCHGVSLSATGPAGMPTWHQHPNAPIGHFYAECGGGGHVCTVTNLAPLALDNPNDRRVHFDLISHEIGHCLTLGHVGDANTEDLDDSLAYPQDDIMSYENDGHHAATMHCPSNLNVRTIEAAFSNLLGQGGSTANQVQNGDQGVYTHMHPDDWFAVDCHQSAATFTDAEWLTTFDPTADDVDGEPEPIGNGPRLFINSPTDEAEVGSDATFTGFVDRQGLTLDADAGGPYQGTVNEATAIAGTAEGGSRSYACAWSTAAAATFTDARSCVTAVTFSELGVHEVLLMVEDGDSFSQASTNVTVTGAPPGGALYFGSEYERYGPDFTDCGQTYRYAMHGGLPAAGKAYSSTGFGAAACGFEFGGTTDVPIAVGQTILVDLVWACDRPAPMAPSVVAPTGQSTSRFLVNLLDSEGNQIGTARYTEPAPTNLVCDTNVRQSSLSIAATRELPPGQMIVAEITAFVLTGDAEQRWTERNLHFIVGGEQPSALYLEGVRPVDGGAPLRQEAQPLPLRIGGARPEHVYNVQEALAKMGVSASSPDGPFVPDYKNADGIGPGSGLLIGNQLCTAAWIFQHPDTGRFYLSTAGHCLMVNSAIGAPIDGTSANAANAVDICFLDCIVNWTAGLDSFVGLRGSYLHLEQTDGYDPVVFAQAQGVGKDFGLIELPADAEPLMRWWLPEWGGATGVETGVGIGDIAVHFGHGTYCCPVVGGALTRTPVDQARVAMFNFNDAENFEAVAGWASGGDSGSPVGLADPLRLADKGVIGGPAVGVLTHGLLPVHSGFFGTLVPQGLRMASTFDPSLNGLKLVTEDGPESGGGGEEGEPSGDGGVVIAELGALVVSDDGSNLILALDLDGLLDGQVPQFHASPIEISVDLFMDHNQANGLQYQADYSFEAVEEDADGLPTGTLFVDHFGFNILSDVGTDGLASICPISADLSGSSFDIENNRATWVLPMSAFTHDNFPTRDDGCAAFTTTGDPLGPGDTVSDIVARAAPKAVILSGFPAVDETPPQDYTIVTDNLPPVANAGPNQALDEGQPVTLAGSCTDAEDNLATCVWSQLSGTAVTFMDAGDGIATFTAPAVDTDQALVFQLTATDVDGASDMDDVTITVNALPVGQEHIELWIDGVKVAPDIPVGPTDADEPTAAWETEVDLAPYVGRSVIVQALWIDGDGSALAFDSVLLTVFSSNQAPTVSIDGPASAKKNKDVTFNADANDADGTIVSYAWDLGDGATASGTSVTHRYKDEGQHVITLTVTDSDGAQSVATHTVMVTKGNG